MTLTAGTRLGPYEVLAPLGAGGMGEVYRARDTRLDRIVALKILPASIGDDDGRRQRFEREARAISGLNHPHICALYDVGRQDGVDYLVMEYVEGETLARRLIAGALPHELVLRYAAQVADALAAAHGGGIVHRDLKPSNIMLTRAGVKLLDFGVARLTTRQTALVADRAQPAETTLTDRGTLVGTLPYMAPEQLEGRDVDARTDIFALGAVMYEMATGRRAFDGRSDASLIAAILSAELTPIRTLEPAAPAGLDHVIRRCLAKDPDDRWQSARDVKLNLDWIAETPGDASVPSIRRLRRERLAWTLAGVFGVAALVALVAFGTLWSGSGATHTQTMRSVFVIEPPDGTTFSPSGAMMALSPNGEHLAFIAFGADGKSRLWIRPLGSVAARVLDGTEGAAQPFWSPDSRFIAFTAGGKLMKVEQAGGDPQIVTGPAVMTGTWSRDGTILFSPELEAPVHRVSASGGDAVPLTKLDPSKGELAHGWPQFLPDGRHFLYSVPSPQPGRSGVYVSSLDSQGGTLVVGVFSNSAYAPPGYLLFGSGRRLVAQPFDATARRLTGNPVPVAHYVMNNLATGRSSFSVSENGLLAYRHEADTELAWFDRAGRRLGSVGTHGHYRDPALSSDGRYVAVSRADPGVDAPDIWLYDLERGISSRQSFDASWDFAPVWSPDGRQIVYAARHTDSYSYSLRYAVRDREVQAPILYRSPRILIPYDCTPDGRAIVGRGSFADRRGMWTLPLLEPRSPSYLPWMRGGEEAATSQLSPDGRWLAYRSNESGSNEVYVRDFPSGGTRWLVSSAGGIEPRWRRDGRELYYLAADRTMMAVAVRAGATFEAGKPTPLFKTRASGSSFGTLSRNQYDVTPDGQRFLILQPVADKPSPITVVVNWTAALRR
jgi:Tol biopolymer transport system component